MPDYMFLLESRLSAEQRAALQRVQETAQAHETNIYLTGGAVRDLISGMPIRDLDFTLEGNPARLARELEKLGARLLTQDDRIRHIELILPGDVDASLAAARDEIYHRPGTKPETRWGTITEDLRRRDFSMNAIALSLNPASRGLVLDPTNGLADLGKHEVRALSIHSFTNQPARLLRIVRYAVRTGFKFEQRTAEWFALAKQRGLHEAIEGEDVGAEVRQLAREEKMIPILKAWENHGLIEAIHPRLARRHPHYDKLTRLTRVRDAVLAALPGGDGNRPRLFAPATYYLLARLKSRERSSALARMGFRSREIEQVVHLEVKAQKAVKMLMSRKTASPRQAYDLLELLPLDLLLFVQTRFSQAKALGKIRRYLTKWKPLRRQLPAEELEALGVPRGPMFDKILESFFDLQLAGKGRKPEERAKLLRRLAGLKPEPKKPEAHAPEKEKEVAAGKFKRSKKAESAPEHAAGTPAPPAAPPPAPEPAEPRPGKGIAKHEKLLKPAPPKRTRPAKTRRIPKPKPRRRSSPPAKPKPRRKLKSRSAKRR